MQSSALFITAIGGLLLFVGFIGLLLGGFREGNQPSNLADAMFGGPFAFMRGLRQCLEDKKSPLRPMLAAFLLGAALIFFALGTMPMEDSNSPRQDATEPPASTP